MSLSGLQINAKCADVEGSTRKTGSQGAEGISAQLQTVIMTNFPLQSFGNLENNNQYQG